jgi:hypothetical protein
VARYTILLFHFPKVLHVLGEDAGIFKRGGLPLRESCPLSIIVSSYTRVSRELETNFLSRGVNNGRVISLRPSWLFNSRQPLALTFCQTGGSWHKEPDVLSRRNLGIRISAMSTPSALTCPLPCFLRVLFGHSYNEDRPGCQRTFLLSSVYQEGLKALPFPFFLSLYPFISLLENFSSGCYLSNLHADPQVNNQITPLILGGDQSRVIDLCYNQSPFFIVHDLACIFTTSF